MVVSPGTIVFAVRSLVRLGAEAQKAYIDSVINRDLVLPDIHVALATPGDKAREIVETALNTGVLQPGDREEQRLRKAVELQLNGGDTPAHLDARVLLCEAAREVDPTFAVHADRAAVTVLKQLSPDAEKVSPLGRMAFALADVALEFVAINPGMFEVGGNADKLIAGMAANLRELLPEPDDAGSLKNGFAEGAIRIFVRAGLNTLHQNADQIIEEQHIRDLSKAVLKPLIEAVDQSGGASDRWYDIRDELLGPIAEAAIGTLATHQAAFLGKSFDPDTAIGAVTNSVLLAVKEGGLADEFNRDGVIRVYRAALDVAVRRPGLFVDTIVINGKTTNIGQALLSDAAGVLRDKSPPFNQVLAIELTAVSIEAIGNNAPLLFDYDGDWGKLATEAAHTAIREISEGLVDGVRGERVDILRRLFNEEQANRFFKIFLEDAAANPSMIIGTKSAPELRALVTIVAKAMSAEEGLLLSAEDWLSVAASVSQEVARNPARLIKLADATEPERQLAYRVISTLLKSAAKDFKNEGRDGGSVMFGATLGRAISDSLIAAAGNAVRASENTDKLDALAGALNEINTKHPGRIGRREWLHLFRMHVARALDTGEVPETTESGLLALIEQAKGANKPQSSGESP